MGGGCSAVRGSQKIHPSADPPQSVVPAASGQAALTKGEDAEGAGYQKAAEKAAADSLQPLLAAATLEAQPRRKPKPTLVKAAKAGDAALTSQLLEEGADVEELGMWDNTPLLIACTYGHGDVALRLVAHKADVAARNEHGATPLHHAAVEGSLRVARALVESARDRHGDAGPAKLANCGTARVYNRNLDAYTQRTPLGLSAESGFLDMAELLLDAGAEVGFNGEGGEERGQSALWLSCRHDRTALVRLLLQRGASPDSKSADNISALGAACAAGADKAALALLAHGVADVNDTEGSPLRDAVRQGKQPLAEALLTHGSRVNPAEGDGQTTPLHAACEKGHEALVALLVRHRADASLRDAAGLSPLDLLTRRGTEESQARALLTAPAEAAGGDGSTGATAATAEEIH